MIGFLTGALAALVLALVTFLALDAFAVTSIERVENPSVNLEDVDHEYSPNSETNLDGLPRE